MQSFDHQATLAERVDVSGLRSKYPAIRDVGALKKWMCACAALVFALLPLPVYAGDEDVAELADEPPQIRALLEKAVALEQSVSDSNEMKQAATLYCRASRLGSIEAQYRLGLLYTLGMGVPENLTYAASLFSQAARQGHAHAQDMLEIVQLRSSDLPSCLLEPSGTPERPAAPARHCRPG